MNDGSVMVTMISAWHHPCEAEGFNRNLEVIYRLPDAGSLKSVETHAIDLAEKTTGEPRIEGDTLHIAVPRHGNRTRRIEGRRLDVYWQGAGCQNGNP